MLDALWGASRMQAKEVRRDVDNLMVLVNVPVETLIFVLIIQHAGRQDLSAHAVLAPVLIALWNMALYVSGEIIANERWQGTLETLVAAPARLEVVLLGRIGAVTAISLLALVESLTVASLLGVRVSLEHPLVFLATMVASAVATAATALIMSAIFVLTRTARTFQNSLNYPFFILGGVIVPVSLLPGWLQGPSRLVFLSWASDLLRDSFQPDPVVGAWVRVLIVLVLGLAGFLLGRMLLRRMVDRVRLTGTLGLE